MGFSWFVEVDGVRCVKFGNAKIRESADGFGTSGVSTSEFTFTLPYAEYGSPRPNAEVKIYAGEDYKIAATYYISSRSRKGGTVSFKCFDRIMFTYQTIIFEDKDFTDDIITAFWLLEKIRSQCGFERYSIIGISSLDDIKILREKVEGKTGYECLQLLSSAFAGYFKVSNDDVLTFVPFGTTVSTLPYSDNVRHTAISEGNIKGPITQVIMSNGKETFLAGNNGADIFNTLKISSDLASQELANDIMERIDGYTYQSWDCQKIAYDVVLADIAAITAAFEFGDGITRIANYMEKIITAYGLFISCGANDVTESEFDYTGKLSREIAKRIADGEELGNKQLVTRYQGIIHLGEKKKENSKGRAAEESPKRYGYAPATYEGVVKFDGAMVDKALPEITVKDDLSGFCTSYGDTVIDYDLEWEGDNVTLKVKEAVE